MEHQPLLLSHKSSLKSNEQHLWTIPEEDSPVLLKERLVYGSVNSSDLLALFRDEDGEEGERNDLAKPAHRPAEEDDAYNKNKSKRYLKKSRTAPAMTVEYTKRSGDNDRPRLDSAAYIVKQAAVGVVVYLALGVAIYMWKDSEFSGSSTHRFIDALYFSIVTMCTIGYGDITPVSPTTKLYCCIFVLVGFGVIDILLSGMVAYILERQEVLLIGAVESGHHTTASHYLINSKEGRMRKRMKVVLAMLVVVGTLAFGTVAVHALEELTWLDSFYLSCMSVTTVGYGDHAFKSFGGRLFASVWLLVSSLAVARAFLFLAEIRIYRRNRLIAKWVMKRGMTVGDLVAADIDNDGYVSKSEFVVYKLKELGLITEDDISEVSSQFNVLDSDNSGRITLSCLSGLSNPV